MARGYYVLEGRGGAKALSDLMDLHFVLEANQQVIKSDSTERLVIIAGGLLIILNW